MTMKLSHLIKTAAVILPVMTGPVAASAASVVTLQCNNFLPQKQGVLQNVISIQAGGGVVLPGTCAVGSMSCAQCVADLLTGGFTPVNSFDTTPANGGVPTPYFVFKK